MMKKVSWSGRWNKRPVDHSKGEKMKAKQLATAGVVLLLLMAPSGCHSSRQETRTYVNSKDSVQRLELTSKPSVKIHLLGPIHDIQSVGDYVHRTGTETIKGSYTKKVEKDKKTEIVFRPNGEKGAWTAEFLSDELLEAKGVMWKLESASVSETVSLKPLADRGEKGQ